MMFNPFCVCRRVAWLAVFVLAAFVITNPKVARGQSFSFSGVTEGGAITLPTGVTTTNLAISATPSSPTGTTNAALVLEYQGSIIANRILPPPYSTTFSNLTAGKYFLSATLVAGGSPPTGNVSFDIKATPLAPANDNWSQAATLVSLDTTVAVTNTYATSELNELQHAGTGAGKSIWWAWSALSNGVFTATTIGSSFDTVLGVYRGTNLSNLMEVGSSDDAGPNAFSQVTFSATNGGTYYFAVDGASGESFGRAQLRLVVGPPSTISITSPADGALFLVASPADATNTQAAVSVSGPAGVARVDYWFDGPDMSRSGILSSPYQLSLTNLLEGHYVLSLAASNTVGLISTANLGLSVISLAPVLYVEGYIPASKVFQMAVTGFKGPTYALQASTNLDVWCGVRTWTNFAGAEKVADTNVTQFNRRFYRASSTE